MKLSDLKPAPYNPRDIDAETLEALGYSLEEFGDLSGLVWNKRTSHIIAGHQRIRSMVESGGKFRDKPPRFEFEGEIFPIRIVDWLLKKEKAANIAANNQTLAGQWDGTLGRVLHEIGEEYGSEYYAKLRFNVLAEKMGFDPPDFEKLTEDTTPRLDQKNPVQCPECGHEFVP